MDVYGEQKNLLPLPGFEPRIFQPEAQVLRPLRYAGSPVNCKYTDSELGSIFTMVVTMCRCEFQYSPLGWRCRVPGAALCSR
jgi:hypothetical protein